MRRDVDPRQVVKAVVKAIVAKFNSSDWMSLALETDQLDYVRNHPRLLRSLDWNDDDYEGNVIDAVPLLLGQKGRGMSARFTNLEAVETATGLKEFLRATDRSLYAALYGSDHEDLFDELRDASTAFGLEDVDVHAARIRHGLHDDPGLAIGSAKDLLETVLKAVLSAAGEAIGHRRTMPQLLGAVNEVLGLNARDVSEDEAAEHRRQFLGSLSRIVTSTAELRNAGYASGHGVLNRPELDVPTARLVVSAAVALATFYIEAQTDTLWRAND